MQDFIYTILDEFSVWSYGNISADSVKDAKDILDEKFKESGCIEIWQAHEKYLGKGDLFSMLHRFFLRKSNANELVYSAPRIFLCAKIFLGFFALAALMQGNTPTFIFLTLFFTCYFICAYKITIRHDHIIQKKRFFHRKEEKQIDISNATRILFEGKRFVSLPGKRFSFFSSKSWCCFFVFIEIEGQKIPIFGGDNMRAEKRMAKKISRFLNLPLEEISGN